MTFNRPLRRVLLLEAPYGYGRAQVLVGSYFPLGIGYLAGWLRQHGHVVEILQPAADEPFEPALEHALERFDPHVVGISVMTPSYPQAVRLCELIKAGRPRVTVLGGHHVSAVGTEVLEQSPATDFAVIGEGERTLLELVDALGRGDTDFGRIPGLVWRDAAGAPRRNEPRAPIQDLDSLPLPARDLVDLSRYRPHSYIDFGRLSATMITSRGCPFRCIFCSSGLTMGKGYRWRSAESVLGEVRELTERYGVDHVVFEDDTMTLRRDRLVEICRGLMDLPRRPSWYCLSRVDSMDQELARLMRRAGCRMVNFGIESGSPEVLERIGKRISLDRAVTAVAACRRARLRTQCTFIVGFPFDTDETIRMTLSAAKRIAPTIAVFFPLTPYPGTAVFDEFMDPALRPRDVQGWQDFIVTGQSSISLNPRYPGPIIRRMAQRFNFRFHMRPRQWLNMLRTVSGLGEALRLARGGVYLLSAALRR